MLYDGVPHDRLASLGETRIPGLADLFVATMKGTYA
jgi:ABC-2 type transport system ATP-binding protein